MNKEKNHKKFTPTAKHFLIGLLLFLTIVGGIYLLNPAQKKPMPIPNPSNRFLENDAWDHYSDAQALTGKPCIVVKKDEQGNEIFTSTTTYRQGNGDRILCQRTTQYSDSSTEDLVEHFLMRLISLQDTEELYELVKASGEEYFGQEPTFKNYGTSKEKCAHQISKREGKMYGIFCSKSGAAKDYKMIGFLGLSKVSNKKDQYLHSNNVYYYAAPSSITGVKGAIKPMAWGISLTFFPNKNQDSRLIFTVHKENIKSQRIIKGLHATNIVYNTSFLDEERPNNEMSSYEITQNIFQNRYRYLHLSQ